LSDDFSERRQGNVKILERLDVIEQRQIERWQATEKILHRLSVLETRQSERWQIVQRDFNKIEQRLFGLETLIKGFSQNGNRVGLTLMVQDPKILLAMAAVVGALLGNSGISIKDFFS
jgi:hypothetical protein